MATHHRLDVGQLRSENLSIDGYPLEPKAMEEKLGGGREVRRMGSNLIWKKTILRDPLRNKKGVLK